MMRRWPSLGFAARRRRFSFDSGRGMSCGTEECSHRLPTVDGRRQPLQPRRHQQLSSVTHLTTRDALYRCRYCGHKSRHRSVAVRHVWRMHRTRISRDSNFLLHCFTSDDISLAFDQEYTRPVVTSSTEPYLAQTPATDCIVGPRSSDDTTTSIVRSSDIDENQLYHFHLVPTSASRTALDKFPDSADFDLLGLPMNPVLPEQQAMCFQSWSSRWNCPLTSAGYYRGQINSLPSDWSYKSTSSTAGSSFNYCSVPPLSIECTKPEKSRMECARSATSQSAVRLPENADSTSFLKPAESLHTERHQSCECAAAVRFACPRCSLSYKRAADLNRHMKQKHRTSLAVFRSSSLRAASLSRDGPLNLTLKDSSFSQRARREQRDHLYCEDTPQDLPLDLSTTSKTLKSNEGSGGQSSERLLDFVDNSPRFSSNQMLPSLIFGDSMLKKCDMSSKDSTSNCHCNAAASLSAFTIPSFYASFAKFMESSALWKSYVDGMMERNATAVRSENKSSLGSAKDCIFSDDLKQMGRFSTNTVESSRPLSTTDNNNNALKYDVTERSSISTDELRPSASTAVEDKETGNKGLGSKDVRSWGQCPLCPFVCPHPLVMRRHLDVHDEPELQRTTHSRQPAASTFKTGSELGALGMRGSFDVTSSVKSYVDGAGRASTSTSSAAMLNCSTWRSSFAVASDGTDTSNTNVLTGSTPNWLSSCPESDLTSAAGKSTNWNTTSVLMSNSASLQTAARQAVIPFTSSLQASGKAEDTWRVGDRQLLYDSSQRSERSRSAKDVKKHISEVHPTGGHVSLAASAANTPWLSSMTRVTTPTRHIPLPPTASTGTVDWWRGWAPDEHLWGTFTGLQSATETSESAAACVQPTPATHTSFSTEMHATDFKKLKRYCCSSCPYRSNFRSDVVRHIRHKHPTVACAAGVSKLDPVSAAATLADYMNTWARKKFVLHSRRRRCHPSRPSQTDKRRVSSLFRSSASVESVRPVTPSEISHGQFTLPGIVNSESPKTFGSEDRLVIDTGSEDYDDVCGVGEHDGQTQSSLSWSNSSEAVAEMNRCALATCRSCDCVHYRKEAHPATDLNDADNTQSTNRDRLQVCEYSERSDWGSRPASLLSTQHVDKRSGSTTSGCLVTVQETAGITCSTVTVNSQTTYNPDHPHSADVTDAASRDVDAATESSGVDNDVSSRQQWSLSSVRTETRLMDVEERRPAEQQRAQLLSPCGPPVAASACTADVEIAGHDSVGVGRRCTAELAEGRCRPVLPANDDDD